jgi:hypothetical protein
LSSFEAIFKWGERPVIRRRCLPDGRWIPLDPNIYIGFVSSPYPNAGRKRPDNPRGRTESLKAAEQIYQG